MKLSWRAKLAIMGCYFVILGCMGMPLIGAPWLFPTDGYQSYIGNIAISPDGSQVAFTYGLNVHRPSKTETVLYVINVDGSNLRRLDLQQTKDRSFYGVQWSADSQVIRYHLNNDDDNRRELSISVPSDDQLIDDRPENSLFHKHACTYESESATKFSYDCEHEKVFFINSLSGDLVFTIDPEKLIRPNKILMSGMYLLSIALMFGLVVGPFMPFPWLISHRYPIGILAMAVILGVYLTIGFCMIILISFASD